VVGLPAQRRVASDDASREPACKAKRLEEAASLPVGNSPEAFRKVVADALDNTRKVVREANLKFE